MNGNIFRRTWARGGWLISFLLLVLALAAPAASREPVDPSTLNPPVPAEFNPVCFESGANIICEVAFSDPDIVAEPSGLVCDGTELLFSQSRSVVGKRYYDSGGNLLRRHFRQYLEGTYVNPDTGAVAQWVQTNTVVHDLAVPGDLGTGPTRITGSLRIWIPGEGTILTDTGVTVLDEATGELLHASENHPFDDYFINGDASAIAPLCEALS